MTNLDVELKLVKLVVDAAVQIYVADIQKTPLNERGQNRPLNPATADSYVTEALTLYDAALPRIRKLIHSA